MKNTMRLSKQSVNHFLDIVPDNHMSEYRLTLMIISSVKVCEQVCVFSNQEISGLFFVSTHIAEYPPVSTQDVKFWVSK
jgi:hypothetical protein